MTLDAQSKENKMGVMPVNKLLLGMSVPMVISMLVQALYNVADSLFVSQISKEALSAVSLAFPMQNLIISVAAGTGVGVNALISRHLGEKDFDEANRTACTGMILGIISSLPFILFGLFLCGPYYSLLSSDASVVKYGIQYLSICACGGFSVILEIMTERLLLSTGKTVFSMCVQGVGAIINIIFDPIFIFGYFGMPKMGTVGAALATVLGQFAAMCLGIFLNHKYNKELDLNYKKYRMNGKTVSQIYKIGVPSIIMQSISSVMTFAFNKIIAIAAGAQETVAIAVFGIYFKLQSIVIMPVIGLNNGMVPIVAYNYGAKKAERMKNTVKLSTLYATTMMLLGLSLIQIFPGTILSWFNATPEMERIGTLALRIVSIHFVIAGVSIVLLSVFQALGDAIYSMIVSLARQLFVLIPAAYILSKINFDLVWWSFPIAEIVSLILCMIFFISVYKRKFHF